MKSFLSKHCLEELINEALSLQDKAFYCSQNHTILLNKPNKSFDPAIP